MNYKIKKLPVSIAALSGLFLATPGYAQESDRTHLLEEVIVTAQKRAESLQDVPLSVSALSGEKMAASGIQELEELSAYVPGYTVAETAIASVVYVRGIGSGANAGFEQSVATYSNGIYYGRATQTRAPFLDVERVEVLRGPQSIIFGKNAIAGAINITNNKPSDEFEGSVSLLLGNDNEQEAKLILSGPITEKISGRLAIRDFEVDGFLDNTTNGGKDPGKDEQTIRGTLRFDVSDTTEVLASYEHSTFDATSRSFQISETGGFPELEGLKFDTKRAIDQTQSGDDVINDPEGQTIELDTVAITVNHDLNEHSITSITGYTSYEVSEGFDADFTAAPIFQVTGVEQFDQYSQEIRLLSPQDGGFEYITGAYFQYSDLRFDEEVPTLLSNAFGPGAPEFGRTTDYDVESTSFSAFAQGSWSLTDFSRLTVGLRYGYEKKEASHNHYLKDYDTGALLTDPALLAGIAGALNFETHEFEDERIEENISWSISLEHDLNSDTMLYASVSTGTKGGGYDSRIVPNDDSQWEFEEEEALNYEAGIKATLGGGVATLNASVFNTQYKNLQVSQFDGRASFVVDNAAETTVRGLEVDGRWQLNEYFTLSGTAAFLDFAYDDYDNANCTAAQQAIFVGDPVDCRQDLAGESSIFVPDLSASVSLEFVRGISDGIEFFGSIDANYSDEYFLQSDLDPNLIQESFTKINSTIGIRPFDDKWQISLVGKNLTDELTSVFGNDVPLKNGAFFRATDRPRSVAIQGTYKF